MWRDSFKTSRVKFEQRYKRKHQQQQQRELNYLAGMHDTTQQDYFFLFISLVSFILKGHTYLHRQSKVPRHTHLQQQHTDTTQLTELWQRTGQVWWYRIFIFFHCQQVPWVTAIRRATFIVLNVDPTCTVWTHLTWTHPQLIIVPAQKYFHTCLNHVC